MEEKLTQFFISLDPWGCQKQIVKLKYTTKIKKKKRKAFSGRVFLSILYCQEGKAGLVILFYSPQEILNMIGKKSGITR